MHLFRNDSNKAKSRRSRVLSVALSAALALGSFSVMAMADTGSIATAKVENVAASYEKASYAKDPTPTPTPITCGTNALGFLKNDVLEIETYGDAEITTTIFQSSIFDNITKVVFVQKAAGDVTIKSAIFMGRSNLTSVTADGTGKFSFASSSFDGCNSLATIRLAASEVVFESYCFYGLDTNVYLPNVTDASKFRIGGASDDDNTKVYFHFNSQVVADTLTANAISPAINGNYVCDNSTVTNPPTPTPMTLQVGLQTSGSMFNLVFKLPQSPYFDGEGEAYGGYQVSINDESVTYSAVDGLFYHKCAAKDMTEKFHLVVSFSGNQPFEDREISVADYLEAVIAESSDTNVVAAAKDMLRYGAAAQMYFGSNTDDLANKNLDSDYSLDSLANVSIEGEPNYYGSSFNTWLNLTYSDYAGITLRFGKELDFYMIFKLKQGATKDSAETEIRGYLGQIGFADTDRDDLVVIKSTATIKSLANTPVMVFSDGAKSVNVSVLDYFKKVLLSDTTSEDLQNLCKALYAFNQSASQIVSQ